MENCIIKELENGEFNGIDIFQVSAVPDITILNNNEYECNLKNKKTFEEIITEFYVSSTSNLNTLYENQDYSIELIFKTEAAANQIYDANVLVYILIRGVDANKTRLELKINEIKKSLKNTLLTSKYSVFEPEDKNEILNNIVQIYKKEKRVIIKQTENKNYSNYYLNEMLTFEKFPSKIANFSKIVNTLMQYPNTIISFSLIPTILNNQENLMLENTNNTLEMVKREIERANQVLPSEISNKIMPIYDYYNQNKTNILFAYNILILSDDIYVQSITNKLSSDISLGDNGEYINLTTIPIYNSEVDIEEYFYSMPWVINEITLDKSIYNRNNLSRIPFVITKEEAINFFRIPYADKSLTAGININKTDQGTKEYNKKVINNGDIMVGSLKNSGDLSNKIGFSLGDLTKHMLVVGTPGSGKTTFSVSLLDRLWKDHNIPFLVIEPAKNEYRAMIDSIPNIQVFTPGKDFISPYIINPFIPPKNVQLQSYKTVLKTAFSAAIQLTTPLDKIFEETIDECYSRAGWLPYYTIDDGAEIFTMDDFLKTFMEVFERIGYKGEASNIGKAGYVRLKSLIKIFGSYNTIPVEDLLTKPTIVELAAIENEEQKCLIIALLLLNIQSYVNANYVGTGEMKNVLLLEEAHVLLASTGSNDQSTANPSLIAKKLLTRMLAEIRSLGVGIVIADQSPEKVTTDIVKLTNIKLAFNLVEFNDRKILKDSTDMDDIQMSRLSKLRPGEAYFYMNGLEEPEEVITEDYRKKVSIRTTISDKEIAEKTTYWLDKKDKLKPFIECGYTSCCKNGCNYRIRAESDEYAKRIYSKYFNEESKDKDKLVEVYKNIEEELKSVSNREIDEQLLCCTKIHFLRRMVYQTKIRFSKKALKGTLEKEYQTKEVDHNE